MCFSETLSLLWLLSRVNPRESEGLPLLACPLPLLLEVWVAMSIAQSVYAFPFQNPSPPRTPEIFSHGCRAMLQHRAEKSPTSNPHFTKNPGGRDVALPNPPWAQPRAIKKGAVFWKALWFLSVPETVSQFLVVLLQKVLVRNGRKPLVLLTVWNCHSVDNNPHPEKWRTSSESFLR